MDEWETGSEAGDAVLYSTGLQTAARDGSDLGGAVNTAERLILGFCTAEEGGSKDRLRRGKEEEEEEKQKQERGQKKGALNRSRKSGKKKKEKEEGRKSFAGVISKFFGKSSTHEEKETINGLQSNARGAEKHRQPSEANNNNDDDDDDDYYDDDDDDDDEEAMWSDGEFDEEFDDDEVYSNVDELRVDLVAKIEIEVTTTTTTTTKSTSASTKDTVTTTNDLIIFESEDAEDEVRREVEEKKEEETLADTEIDRSSVAKPSGKVLAGVPLSRRCNEIDYDLSKNIDHDQSRSVDKDRQDQETDRMPSIQSARRFFEVDSNFKKSAASELGKDKSRIQNFGSKNEAKKLEPKRVIEKPDILDFTKTKTANSNDKAGSIRQPGEENQQAQRALNTASKSTVPTGRQTGVWSGTTSPINRFVNKQCTAAAAAAAEQPPRTATKGRNATGSGGGSPSGGGEGEGTPDANRSKIAAVHSLVKLFDTTEARCRSPDLSRTPRPAKDVVPTPQQRLTGDSRTELWTREKPALKKKPIVETPKQPNSARLFTATPMTCPAPPVLPTRGANPGRRSPPTGSGLPGSRHPPGSRTGPSSTVPSDNAATVNRVYLPPVPRASSKEPSKIGAKDIPNAGATTPQQDNRVNQVGELRKNLRKAPEKYNEEPLVDRSSSKQSPSLPYRPPKFQANGVVEGNVYGPKIDRLNEKEMAEKQLEQQVWYFGDSSREECEARLQSVGQNGTFVVRRSKFGGEKCPYTLSVFLDQATVSLSIRRRTDNTFALGTEKANEMVYSDVMEIVRFHRVNPVRLHNGKTLTLKTSPPK